MAHVRYSGKTSVDVAGNFSMVLGRQLCVNGTPWILFLFEECVENKWEYWSVVIGLISMLCFLFSTLPQVYEAYKSGKVDEAMSVGFLLFLLGGDVSNFAGCLLTSQLPIQIVTAVFYIYTDSILISQYLYYKIKNNSARRKTLLRLVCLIWFGVGTAVCVVLPKLVEETSAIPNLQLQGKSSGLMTSGYACGYLSSICYLSSRFPQLHINYKRQSTEGTSYMLFFLAMLGNGTYGLSLMVMLPALKGSKSTFILNHLAWLIGSLGVFFLDFFVTAQFIMYRKNRSSEAVQDMKAAEEEPLLFEEECEMSLKMSEM
ncbi:lysosomal amino acid transporter 1 homolog [Clupea harengus]|uniref:Lysosomal amino acid transporter 1 homolog n=1 Tax=Clupea harengus TaxID=7950 RepID=A0A6P3VRL6_CLUHA|nr:lysosomal amino acid transporter 1 homolog [Clupea harengus]